MPLLNIDRAAYDALPGHNWSRLKHALKSAASYRANLAAPHEDTPAMRLGRLTHLAVLEWARYGNECAIYNGTRRGKEWDTFRAAHAGCEIVSQDEVDTAESIREAILKGGCAHLLRDMRSEVSMTWEVDGIACKGRIDALTGSLLWDLKTCQDASADAFGRTSVSSEYLAQMAFYADGMKACGVELKGVGLLAVEKEPPFLHALYMLDETALAIGRSRYMKALRVVAEAEFLDEWPGLEPVAPLRIPRWAMSIEGD